MLIAKKLPTSGPRAGNEGQGGLIHLDILVKKIKSIGSLIDSTMLK